MQRDLNDTLIFVKVVEAGSFTAAARALALPKTTVSRKLKDLEERLGVRLMNRTTRSLALTEAGTLYFEHSRRIAAELDEAENAVHQLEGSPRGWLRITAPYALSVALLAPIISDFRRRYPEVRVDVVLSNERLDLVANRIDVALRVGDLPDSTLVARRLATWPTYLYAAESYLAQHGEPLVPDDLRDHRTLALSKYRTQNGFAWPLRSAERPLQPVEVEIRPVVSGNDPEMLMMLLSAGEGLLLTTEPMVLCCPELRNVRRVLGAWRGPDIDLNAVFVGGRVLSPKVRVFVDVVAERMQRWGSEGCREKDGERIAS